MSVHCASLYVQVPYAVFIPSHLVSTFTIARSTALVVDVGFIETTILPVSCRSILLLSVVVIFEGS